MCCDGRILLSRLLLQCLAPSTAAGWSCIPAAHINVTCAAVPLHPVNASTSLQSRQLLFVRPVEPAADLYGAMRHLLVALQTRGKQEALHIQTHEVIITRLGLL
jgi:hypothetical protein